MASLLRTTIYLLLLWILPSVFCNISYRLPLEVIPVSYDIQLVPYLNEGDISRHFTFDGAVSIVVRAERPQNTITLHAKDIKLKDTPTLMKIDSGVLINVTEVSQNILRDFMILHLETPLYTWQLYRVTINYVGYLADNAGGFYRTYYMNRGYKRWVAATQFEPTKARRAFPCFDEPALKAVFTISIARHSHMMSLSNMPLWKTSGADHSLNGRHWDVFKTSEKMSTYLVAFVVSDFKSIHAGIFRVWSKPNSLYFASFALQVSPLILEAMENFTQIPFQLPKLDEVALPGHGPGAMENWGLVIYGPEQNVASTEVPIHGCDNMVAAGVRVVLSNDFSEHDGERNLLLQEDTPIQRQRIVTIIAHEFAHQWFGNLVTLNWWKYTWLNEGFATYFQYHATDKIFPEWRLPQLHVISCQFSAMSLDCEKTVKPLTREVETTADAHDTFSKVYYDKGGIIVRMMSHVLTQSTFYKGLQIYLRSRAFSDAIDEDLYDSLQQAADEDGALPNGPTVKDIMNSWTRQAGYPLVTVIRDYSLGTVTLSQERFFLDRESIADDSKWYIPITFTSSTELDFTHTKPILWLTPNEDLTLLNTVENNHWLIFNIQASGYYRVNYDAYNWNMLQAYLYGKNFVMIHPLNRAQLLDDVQNLVDAGKLEPNVSLGITRYLENETDVIPWLTAFKGLKKMFARLGGSAGFSALQHFYLVLMERLYETIGFDPQADDSHPIGLARIQVINWACQLGHRGCLINSANRVESGTRLNSDVRKAIYCAAVRHDGELSWNLLLKEYETCLDVRRRQELLTALGCTSNTTLTNRLLYLTVMEGSKLKPEDRLNVFPAACNGRDCVSCDVTLEFLSAHFHELARAFGEYESVATLMLRIAPNIKTRNQLQWMLIIMARHEANLRSADVIVRSAVKIAEENLEWLETTGVKITSWIKSQGYS